MANFEIERTLELQQIRNRLKEIEDTVYAQRRPIAKIDFVETGPGKGPERPPARGWKPFDPKRRWGGFDQTTWFRLRVTVPKKMAGETVVALVRAADWAMIPQSTGLTEGGESLAYVNGVPFQGLDRNRDELLLAKRAKGGEKFEIALEACPSTRYDLYHFFCYADIAVRRELPWDFYWDATVALEVCEALDENFAPRRRLLELVNESVKSVDLADVDSVRYMTSLRRAQRRLRSGLKEFETSYGVGKLVLAGHAHIDTAWLWPIRETQRKCARTFSTILELMDRYPEFHFSCSQPVQYEWIKTYYPELFRRIKKRVSEGRWELCGAPWVEPDHNVPSGESLIRQYLYGNRWFEKEFGKRSHIAWVPDSFGYPWQLPQIMKLCQLSAFVTTKIDWSEFTEFPYSMFLWEGADGTRIPAIMPPLNYNGDPRPKDLIEQWDKFKQKERVEEIPFAFGYGDGGGGPTMGMIERGKRLGNMVGVPRCEFGRIEDCVDRMVEQCDESKLPIYNDELYLELHRGCQTSQARTKRNNRLCENLFRAAEFVSSLESMHGGKYDSKGLYEAWKKVLTNQFHDILPGTSLTEVYELCDADYAEAQSITQGILDKALKSFVERIDTSGEGTPVVVLNTTSWWRYDAFEVEAPLPKGAFTVVDEEGIPIPHQVIAKNRLLCDPSDGVPPLGYCVYRIVSGGEKAEPFGKLRVSPRGIENETLKIVFDKAGRLRRVYDKVEEREVLAEGRFGNDLQLFDDRPHLYDAWDIDVNFEEVERTLGPAESMEVIERGPVRAAVRFVRKTETSTIVQEVRLCAGDRRIDFVTRVDWQERHALLKVAFPVSIRSSSAAYEIQFGTIERPTHDNRPHDRARFEVCGHKWADLSEGGYGVSLLNDCKYGYDIKGNVLRLSLLRSPTDPDPVADRGEHRFTYCLYPHCEDWRNGSVQSGYELNNPLIAVAVRGTEGPLPKRASFASIDADNVVIDTVKKHEDSNALIVRCYEAHGQRNRVTMTLGAAPKSVSECDAMEENDTPVKIEGRELRFSIKPYEIRTFKIRF